MLDIVQYLKNTALVIGLKKADSALAGDNITREVVDQIQVFTKDIKKTTLIKDGPLKNFMREMYSGLFQDPETLRHDLVSWCASLKGGSDGGTQEEKTKRGNSGNFGPGGRK